MLPSAIVSKDVVFKVFNIANLAIFTAVVYQVVRHHRN
jgi:hypothetical protein